MIEHKDIDTPATPCSHGGHAHTHGHAHGAGASVRRLVWVLGLTTVYMLAEAVGGWWTNSLALLSDAGHMLADVAAIGLSLVAIWFGSRPAPAEKTYGYYRIEILAAFANGVSLVVLALFIVWEAVERLTAPPTVASGEMMAIAVGGLIVNLISAWLLWSRGEGETRTLNEHGAYLHVLGDALGSLGAIGAGALMLGFGWYTADPITSVAIALLIILSSFGLIREAVNVLLEGTPSHINIAAVKQAILEIDDVIDVHDLHVWTITSGKDALSAHVVCDCEHYDKGLVERVRHAISSRFGISHLTIQLETPDFEEDALHF